MNPVAARVKAVQLAQGRGIVAQALQLPRAVVAVAERLPRARRLRHQATRLIIAVVGDNPALISAARKIAKITLMPGVFSLFGDRVRMNVVQKVTLK